MIKLISYILIAGLFIVCQVEKQKEPSRLIILDNGQVEAGICPDLGGRVMLLRKPGMHNILKSDYLICADSVARPELSAFSEFKPFNGHIVWLSPQSEWWTKQTMNRERRDRRAQWPPDPFLIYGRYRITEQTALHLKMTGPESPLSGVQLTKSITLDPDSALITFTAQAVNRRTVPVSWGLWMNTRFNGYARCYVPADSSGLKKLLIKKGEGDIPMPYRFVERYFTFEPPLKIHTDQKFVQKTFLSPRDNYIAAFDHKQMMLISFVRIPAGLIHPEQAPVEIYNMCDENDQLLEMEIHGAYQSIAPGDSIQLSEVWKIFKYSGEEDPFSQTRFLERFK